MIEHITFNDLLKRWKLLKQQNAELLGIHGWTKISDVKNNGRQVTVTLSTGIIMKKLGNTALRLRVGAEEAVTTA